MFRIKERHWTMITEPRGAVNVHVRPEKLLRLWHYPKKINHYRIFDRQKTLYALFPYNIIFTQGVSNRLVLTGSEKVFVHAFQSRR